jgi:hypothetical protein
MSLLLDFFTGGPARIQGLLVAFLAALALCTSLACWALWERSSAAQARAELATFRAQVATAAEKAAEEALRRTIADERRKEQVDADHAKDLAALDSRIASLRARRADSGILPATAACPGRPDVAAINRAEYQRAYGALVDGLRGLGDEGSRAVMDLDAAKRWAQP